jgi:hypothetical protein
MSGKNRPKAAVSPFPTAQPQRKPVGWKPQSWNCRTELSNEVRANVADNGRGALGAIDKNEAFKMTLAMPQCSKDTEIRI